MSKLEWTRLIRERVDQCGFQPNRTDFPEPFHGPGRGRSGYSRNCAPDSRTPGIFECIALIRVENEISVLVFRCEYISAIDWKENRGFCGRLISMNCTNVVSFEAQHQRAGEHLVQKFQFRTIRIWCRCLQTLPFSSIAYKIDQAYLFNKEDYAISRREKKGRLKKDYKTTGM